MNFDAAFAKLIDARREGTTLSLDPNDRGNWTGGAVGLGKLVGSKYGISAATYPSEDIANMTVERAGVLYRRDYWGPAGCDGVPDRLKFDLFDMAVNSGVGAAVRTLQKAAGLPAAEQDGRMGPLTLQAVQSASELQLFARFNGVRLMFLADAPGWPVEGRGWARRVAANLLGA